MARWTPGLVCFLAILNKQYVAKNAAGPVPYVTLFN